jgi:hypothetical protein
VEVYEVQVVVIVRKADVSFSASKGFNGTVAK